MNLSVSSSGDDWNALYAQYKAASFLTKQTMLSNLHMDKQIFNDFETWCQQQGDTCDANFYFDKVFAGQKWTPPTVMMLI